MKKSVVLLIHIGYWFCFVALIGIVIGVAYRNGIENEKALYLFQVISLYVILPSALAFYFFYYYLFPTYILKKRIRIAIPIGFGIALVSACIGYGLLYLFVGEECLYPEGQEEDDSIIGLLIFAAFFASISGIIALIIRGFINWFGDIKLKEELKQKSHEMELALVKSQLDPHFLFNTINNIDVLIIKKPEVASEYLNKLSDIMRFMLFETKSDEIFLTEEIKYIEKYIELQKIRTANSNYISYSITGDPNSRKVAPMIFIPFIENAFKHTNNKKIEDAINISIAINETGIEMSCINKYDSSRKSDQESNGLGNNLIEKRLNLIYPNRHKLEISNKNETYSVKLTISND